MVRVPKDIPMFRKDLIDLLLGNPMTLTQIARQVEWVGSKRYAPRLI